MEKVSWELLATKLKMKFFVFTCFNLDEKLVLIYSYALKFVTENSCMIKRVEEYCGIRIELMQ